jgi:hypothetical protein
MPQSLLQWLKQNQFAALAVAGFITFSVQRLCTNLHEDVFEQVLFKRPKSRHHKKHANPKEDEEDNNNNEDAYDNKQYVAAKKNGHSHQRRTVWLNDATDNRAAAPKEALQHQPLVPEKVKPAAEKKRRRFAILRRIARRRVWRAFALHLVQFFLAVLLAYVLANFVFRTDQNISHYLLPSSLHNDLVKEQQKNVHNKKRIVENLERSAIPKMPPLSRRGSFQSTHRYENMTEL